MARRKKPPEHQNHERWLVSYADFITLLFAFFTTMYAISRVDQVKVSELAHALSAALGGAGPPRPFNTVGASPSIAPTPGRQPQGGHKRGDRQLAELAQSLSKLAQSFGGDARFSVRVDPRGVVLSLGEAALFGPGDARLRAQALPLLDAITHLLLQNPHPLIIEGHSDDRSTTQPSLNWRLSTERAVTVLSYLVEEHGYPPQRMAAAGYGQYHPVADNATTDGRARNRRVDLIILRDESVPPDYRR